MIIRQRRLTYQSAHWFHSSCQLDAVHISIDNRCWQQGNNWRHFDMVDCHMQTCLKTRASTIINKTTIINIPAVVEIVVVVVYVPASWVHVTVPLGQAQIAAEPKLIQVPPLIHSPLPHRPSETWRAKRWLDAASICIDATKIAKSVKTKKDEGLSMI